MSTLVRYNHDGNERELDLAELSPADYDLIKALHLQIDRGDRVLLCQQAPGDDDGAEMFVKLYRGRYWAVHFRGSGCTQKHEIKSESDEHRRQKDYWYRAAEDAGYQATKEYNTGRSTVLDVAIDGPYRTGIEVQRSAIEPRQVKSRTTRSFGAGWLPVWFLDSDRKPPWFYEVPTLGCNDLPWSSLPPRRAAPALGPRRMIPTRCTISDYNTCPTAGRPTTGRTKRRRSKGACGRLHPKPEPWPGLTVDDVAAMLPAGELVAMRDLLGDVRLISPADLELFQDMTELSGEYRPGTATRLRGRPAPRTTECANTGHRRVHAVRQCAKCGLRPPGPGGILCETCCLMIQGRTAHDIYAQLPRRPGTTFR
ncbi:hypothetical protein [Amycolatopsis sp. NPDC059021]|uniref:hypothetical protein n=1 Tax=Amycolatopsis sp. NPDC059021 TaxID=3346704 RepID=UPI00366B4305